uniref:Uncharacterized protein n=1 Tax=Panagrolaimus sp. ES5 TaxID=591445 RepID=A0AC34GXI0_9BILA
MSRKFRSVFFQLFFKGCKDKFDDVDDFNQFFERTDLSNRKCSSALTTNHTRTEQLSHYPSTASTLNASHYDHNNPPSIFSHYKSNLLSVGDPTASRRSSSSDYQNRRFSTAMSSFEPPSTATTATAGTKNNHHHNTAKRISFNLANDPPSSSCQKSSNRLIEKIPAKNSIIKSSAKVGTFSRIRERIKPLNKLGQYIWNHESVMLINDSTNSPQRRLNNIQTETNFVGLAY